MSLASVYNSCQQDTGNIVVVVVTLGKASRDTRNYFVSWSTQSERQRQSELETDRGVYSLAEGYDKLHSHGQEINRTL